KEIMRDDPVVIPYNTSLHQIIELFFNSHHSQFFVVDPEQRLVGRITLNDIRRMLQEREYLADIVIAHDLMMPNIAVIHADDTLDQVMRIFGRYLVEELPVVSVQNGSKIAGVVFYRDVIEAYNQELVKRDLVTETGASFKVLEKSQKISFMDGYEMAAIPVSMRFAGKTLQELDLRHRYGVNVLMIKRKNPDNTERQIVPLPEETIQLGDMLIAMGKEKDLEKLRHA
ncbi:CBS domain-containing protein, partial [Candidatus Saccharibacteria bacterium]|nr:CBS domain-containing protein [Candidatus Saccharibacteria bacterium]NIV03619.1 CBS domain-containing protein [Calditrichia bacterium]NIV71910.1 CBS domain-containing protein [Calditrichia bacterium]NIV98674.1 CBS domain-containing protein [Candidatus Saccharibacteria bacterium]NIW78917.1 CBS domain-containing protein [Calditrichia bacterium]